MRKVLVQTHARAVLAQDAGQRRLTYSMGSRRMSVPSSSSRSKAYKKARCSSYHTWTGRKRSVVWARSGIKIRPCFTLVTDHIPEFVKRGLCARDPKRALADSIAMRMPRKPANGDAFKPYSPAATLPYAHRWRLFRTPNDAFLAANTHREGTPLLDILQPAYAGLYSGAIHPTAEAHAIVADHVVRHVRAIVGRQDAPQDVLESRAQ